MKLTKIIDIIRGTLRKISDDYVSVFSAQAAFFIFLSFFPFLMFLLTLLQYLPFAEDFLMNSFPNIVPKALHAFVDTIIQDVYHNASGTIISITAITALWSSSKGFLGIVRGLNSVYGIKETRNYFKLRILSSLYTLIFTLLIIVTLVLLVFGNRLYLWIQHQIPYLEELALLIISLRAIFSLCILASFFLLLYIFIPNRKTRLISELPGALVASAGWLIFSYLYSYYIDNMRQLTSTYGSLTAIVFLMLWVYFCMYILFIGAEINHYTTITKWFTKKADSSVTKVK